MARGWESKSVEAQLEEAAATREAGGKQAISADEADRLRQRELLLMSRNRTQQLLAGATNERYRQLLEQELKALDDQIAALGKS